MAPSFQQLRQHQLDRTLSQPLSAAPPRPTRGWIRAAREAFGVSSSRLASWLRSSRQLIFQFEVAEAEDRITLASLRSVANALDCELVYAFVPRGGSYAALAEKHLAEQAAQNVSRVEHHMALEDQDEGDLDQLIDHETDRLRGKRS